MKQHISPKQAKDVTEDQFYSFFDSIVPRNNWANYHHKKMSIGFMIEYLSHRTQKGGLVIRQHPKTKRWCVEIMSIKEINGHYHRTYTKTELADALWEAIKQYTQ